jgi:hypothetical protein
MACCPAHDDRNPSLSVRRAPDGRVLVHCFAGCSLHADLAYRPWLAPALKGRVVNLAFDSDAAGDAAAREWEERLAPIKTRRVRPTRGKDGTEAPRCRVLFMTGEDDMADTEMPRLEAAGADLSRVFFMKAKPDHGRWSLLEDAETIEEQVKHCGADLLIIDPLTEFLANVDTHRDNEVRCVLGRLRDLAKGRRCAVLAVRHLNKRAGAAAIYRGGGSIAFTGAARFVFTVGHDPDDRRRRAFAMTKCNVAPELPTLLYRTVPAGATARIEWLGKSNPTPEQILELPNDRPRDQAREFLEEALAQGPVAAAEVIERAEAEGISEKTLKRAKGNLGVQSQRSGASWEWSLNPLHEAPQGAHEGHFPTSEK